MNRDPETTKFPAPVINNHGPGRDIPRVRPSVYDARYLRTTDLSKGSKIMTVSDPYSYIKHGLLHDGQEWLGELLIFQKYIKKFNITKLLPRVIKLL